MTPTQARAFLAVAIEGSFTGAAKRLNVSQPSITTQVGLIERQYKVELFHRIGRGVRLTPAGTALLSATRESMGPTVMMGSAYPKAQIYGKRRWREQLAMSLFCLQARTV